MKYINISHIVILFLFLQIPQSFAKESEALLKLSEEIKQLQKISTDNQNLKHWYLLKKAIYQLESNKYQEALKDLSSIPSNSAASPQALLYKAEVEFSLNPKLVTDESLNAVEAKIKRGYRDDLKARLIILKADYYKGNKQLKKAKDNYLKLINSYQFSKFTPDAFRKLSTLAPKRSASLQILKKQINYLMNTGKNLEAEEYLKEAKSRVQKNSEEYYTLLLTESSIKKALGDKESARAIISQVAKQNKYSALSRNSYLNLILASWNLGKKDQALNEIDTFVSKHPSSDLVSKAKYVKARILGEKHLYVESKEEYLDLFNSLNKKKSFSKNDKKYYLKSLKELAWLYIRNSNEEKASKYFKILEQESKKLSDAHYSHHSYFWQKELNKDKDSGSKLSFDPFNFYTLSLGSRHISKLLNTKGGSCKPSMPSQLNKEILALKNSGFSRLAQHEINWKLRPQLKNLKGLGSNPSIENLKSYLNTSHAYFEAGSSQQGLLLSGKVLRQLAPNMNSFIKYSTDSSKADCLRSFIKLYYPSPFKDIYQKESQRFGVPLSLILALSRTESHFRASAVSPVGAKGLMQLMQKTAEQEGLKNNEDLFDPEVNIRLGVKHLKRVLDYYNGDLKPAIASYNAGKKSVDRWRERYKNLPQKYWAEQIGYPETYNYVQKVIAAQMIYDAIEGD